MIQTQKKKLNMDSNSLRRSLPETPGVYLFRDRSNNIIYIGKAKNLKKRVLSYFRPLSDLPHKTALMMNRTKNLDYILTTTENEAFILESSLIKRHMPRYNIILRDDKQYPCLRLSVMESYPRLSIVRKIKKDGALYFGPFSSSHSVRSTLKLIERLFRLRKCKRSGLPRRSRPCLNYQLDRCLGPCAKDVPVASYREIVEQVKLFLDGSNRELLRQLEKDMRRFAGQQDFEEAARIRDQIRAVERTIERQNVVSQGMEDQDVIGLSQEDGIFQLVILFIRKGYLIGSRDYRFRGKGASASEVIEALLKQYYHKAAFVPEKILISEPIDDMVPIREWLSHMAGKKIAIHRPLRGKKAGLVRMAVSNAESLIARYGPPGKDEIPELLKSVLKLKKAPRRIEGLDISNLQGSLAVGTIVSFVEDLPSKAGYRNYRIRGVKGIDDYGMMSELALRRLSGGKPPDLFVVDGGKGHLLAVKKVIENLTVGEMPEVVSIAKSDEKGPDKRDKVYLAGRKNPLPLRRDNPVLLLLMRIRDEAHRRAITYHRKLRESSMDRSRLDLIPGIGPKKKRLLLKHFGDIASISRARPEELALVSGISDSMALDISRFFLQGTGKKG
ncbi:excinuclease ABC subunit UvrC [Deltaproteobacteria bacterium]|nr:excinuclease ABC subunit UvrC [Deltaproteobacteria bacterium]